MTNQITAQVQFDFKGETLAPTAILDLDRLMMQHGGIPPLHQLLATLNDIDSYSYEYEIMLEQDVLFIDPKGMACDFVQGTSFDQAGFEQHWHEQQLFNSLTPLLKTNMNIDDIHQHPELKSVLVAAFKAGKDHN